MANSSSTTQRSKWWLVLPFGVVVVAWGMCWWTLAADPDRGTFGDMFGSVNALFSGLAFAGLIVAIRLQSEELALQRDELAETRAVLHDQKTQMESQAKTLELQQFESTFFQLLRTLSDIVAAMNLVAMRGQHVTQGRNCLRTFYEDLEAVLLTKGLAGSTPEEQASNAYVIFYQRNEYALGHYFRHLYHIIKFVDSSRVENKRRYTSFVRAQISSYESLLLFYNCLSPLGILKFRPLVEKYGLLKHLPRHRVPDSLIRTFKPIAYLSLSPDGSELSAIDAISLDEYQISDKHEA